MALKKAQHLFIGKRSHVKEVEKELRESNDPIVRRLVEEHGMERDEAIKEWARWLVGMEKAFRTKPLFPELEMPEWQKQLRVSWVDKKNHNRKKPAFRKKMTKH
ncbi:MAG: hypothetical protein ONB46_16345 [candidate division KSB1 bacterium]|nr:hypothetical protein [candidate division KSB1 bacterium]MDZ7367272.1 hypothetical protein [candidate division KSB1 bacterium]MDZ7405889.1 hypothetical protein [candidate division KSB1 bacterium]